MDFYKKQCLPVVTWNKKHLLKQIATIKYTLEKMSLAVATFEDLRVVTFETESKKCLLCMTLL